MLWSVCFGIYLHFVNCGEFGILGGPTLRSSHFRVNTMAKKYESSRLWFCWPTKHFQRVDDDERKLGIYKQLLFPPQKDHPLKPCSSNPPPPHPPGQDPCTSHSPIWPSTQQQLRYFLPPRALSPPFPSSSPSPSPSRFPLQSPRHYHPNPGFHRGHPRSQSRRSNRP